MNVVWNKSRAAIGLIAVLIFANQAQAQSRPAASAPAPSATHAQPTAGPDAIFARWDKDNNKTLSLDEFKTGWQEVQSMMFLLKLHENFVAMDTNRSGALEAAEYAHLELIKKAGASAPAMSTFDADKNQALDFKEYVGMVDTMMKNKH